MESKAMVEGTINKENNPIDHIKKSLNTLWHKLQKLKYKLGFEAISDDFGNFMNLQEKFSRNKARASIDDEIQEELSAEIEAMLGRLEIYENLGQEEIRILKKGKPFTLMGKKIEFGNYKKVGTIVIWTGGIYIGYRLIIRPIIWPVFKKVMNTKIRNPSSAKHDIKDAEYRVI